MWPFTVRFPSVKTSNKTSNTPVSRLIGNVDFTGEFLKTKVVRRR